MLRSMANNLLMIVGPTASGKTRLGVELARRVGGEILSVDSRQVYRGLDIGSGKDLDEYAAGGTPVPYHLIDIVELSAEFSVFDFQKTFFRCFEDLEKRRVPPIAVGGSGLYIEAALNPVRMAEVPEHPGLRASLEDVSLEALGRRLQALRDVHNTTDLKDRTRLIRAIEIAEYRATHEALPSPEIRPVILGVLWERDVLRRRIRQRLSQRLDNGLIEEVERLHQAGVSWEKLRFLGLEYRFVADYLRGDIRNRNDLKQKLGSAICNFAKRQDTWFRRMERRGVTIHWIEEGRVATAIRAIEGAGGFRGIGTGT